MTAYGRGLSRAMGASPHPAWRRALSDTRGRLKPEYDAVVVGAGKAGWAGVEGPEGSLLRILVGGGRASTPLASHCFGTGWPGFGVRASARVKTPPVCEQVPGFWSWLCR